MKALFCTGFALQEWGYTFVVKYQITISFLLGDKVTPIITKLELDQCRISLSLKKAQEDPLEQNLDTLMPLDAGTVSDLQWEDSGAPFPELEGIVQELRNEPKVNSVEFGRSAEAPRAVSQVIRCMS